MGGHTFCNDLLQLIHAEQIIQDHAEAIQIIALLVLCVIHLMGHLIILNDRGLAILEAEHTDSLLRISFSHYFCAADTVLVNHCAHKAGISDSLQYIVYGKAVEPFYAHFLGFL